MENVSYKKCNKCSILKTLDNYTKHRGACRACRKIQAQRWAETNRERFDEYQSNYKHNRYKQDLQFKIKCVLRARLRKALKDNWKTGSAVKGLGCSVDEFKNYIESKFQPGMSWDNWSRDGWHLDHIKPLDSFDLSNEQELEKACHYTNLQPLWATENCTKSNKVEC